MPSYEIEHSHPFTPAQQDKLAEAITKIHCETFDALSIFVNVRFTDIGKQTVYVAGKRRNTNRILAHVRHGPSRTRAHYDTLCQKLQEAWNDIINDAATEHPNFPKSGAPRDLRAVFVMGDINAGLEAGFLLPEPGSDGQWVKENMEAFRKRAEEGDEEFVELVKEVEERGMA